MKKTDMRYAPRLLGAMLLMYVGLASAAPLCDVDQLAPKLFINPAMAVGQKHPDAPLFAATLDGNLEAITTLLRQPGANVNARDSDGMTALMWAARQHNDDLVHFLVQHGADAGARDKYGNTALIQVMRNDDATSDLMKYLCPNKTVANIRNTDGKTALMVYACANGYSANSGGAADLLVSLGADVNAQDADGNTALMYAAANSAVEVAQTLISAGARVDAKNKFGENAFDQIPPGGDDVAKLLMAAGIKVPNWDGIWEGTMGGRSIMLCMSMNKFNKKRTAAYYALEVRNLMFLTPSSNNAAPNDDLVLQGEAGTWELPIRYHSEEISGVFSSPETRQSIHLTKIHDFRNDEYGNPCASRTFLNGLTQPSGQTCAGTNVTTETATCVANPAFALVANNGGDNVSVYKIGSSGALTQVGSPFAAGTNPISVAVNPAGTLAFVANSNSNTVSVYSIGCSGALTPVSGSPFDNGARTYPVSVAANHAGTLAFVANYGGGVSVYSIGCSGMLIPVEGNPFAAGTNPVFVAVNHAGTLAFVANPSSHTVSVYSIDSNGALTQVGSPFATGENPRSVAVNPAGTLGFVANSGDNTVSVYSIGGSGALAPVAGSPFATGRFPISVAVNPAGTLAFVANEGSNNVSVYSIGAGGALTQVTGSPFAAGTSPISVAVNPAGILVFVANTGSNNVSVYSIGAGGALAQVTGSPFTAGTSPASVAIAQP